MEALSDLDGRLLDLIQEQIPLVSRPYAALGDMLGASEAEVIGRIAALKAGHGGGRGVIRQIGAIFDSKSLGSQTALVAARIEASKLEAAAALINEHPGVSHNYQRDHAYNLWYTLAVPPDSALGIDGTLSALHKLSEAAATRPMPTLKLFKIGVKLNLSGKNHPAAPTFGPEQQREAMSHAVTERDRELIRVLQRDLEATAEPFDAPAREAGVSVGELLEAAKVFQSQKRMRRFSAVLRHRELGFEANGMGVWVVPAEKQDEFGRIAAGFSAVSHCYLRPSYEDWPYNIFTMIHAQKRSEGEEILRQISAATGVSRYDALYSTREFKKVRVRYFTGEIEAWEKAHAP